MAKKRIGKEEHNTLGAFAPARTEISEITKISSVVAYKDFIYRVANTLSKSMLCISDPAKTEVYYTGNENVTNLHWKETEILASGLFISNDKLIVCYDEISTERSLTFVSIYSLADPNNPKLISTYKQTGICSAVYTYKENLCLVISDGVCACGRSTIDDMSEYYPNLTKDEKSVFWGDEDISVLGEPTRISYATIIKIDIDTAELVDKHAFYGDVREIFYGPDWITVETMPFLDKYIAHPDIYTFETSNGINFTGKIDIPKIAGYKRKVPAPYADNKNKHERFTFHSMDRVDGIYRIIGYDDCYIYDYEAKKVFTFRIIL